MMTTVYPSILEAAATWLGIAFCISQSAMFSGLNLAMFGVSRLRLEVESSTGAQNAKKLLNLRKDSNFLLATLLWGNVAANVMLTLLSDSVLTGVAAFLFSSIVITCIGEILPQAYFSRNALRMVSVLAPILRIYQFILYPVAKPCGLILDSWLGKEGIEYYRERGLSEIIRRHVEADETDLEHAEGKGAMNFFELDDLHVSKEGEAIHPDSIIQLEANLDLPIIPDFTKKNDDTFLQKVNASGKKWVILVDETDEPHLVMDADAFLRSATLGPAVNPYAFCHRPIVIRSEETSLGKVILKLQVNPIDNTDDVIDHDLILLWGKERRIITGADILGRLLRGISKRVSKGPKTLPIKQS